MVSAVPADLAAALKYGAATQQTVRRSKYLSDALKQMQSGSQPITGGYGEVGAKLLATAILQRANNKAEKATLEALKADQGNETASLVKALSPTPAAPVPVIAQPTLQPSPQLPPAQPQTASLPAAVPAAPIQTGAPQITPDVDKIVRTVWGEARSEPPEGQQGVASVILNRANSRNMTPEQVVTQPHQFEPWGNPKTRAQMASLDPSGPEYQAILRNIAPALAGQDPTGGADHFYSPTAQSALGRPAPAWDDGSGRDMGRHRFFDLEPNAQRAQQPAPPPPPPPPPPNPNGPDVQIVGGPAADTIPSALGGSQPGAGGPAAGAPPQAQTPAAASPQWPTWKPSSEELGYVEQLLNDPRYHDEGVKMAMQLREKMTQPAEAQIIQQNGVSFYVSKTPGAGGQPVMIPVQPGAQTQTVSAQAAGLPSAPQGLYVQRDPYGNLKEAPGAPPSGYNAGPEGYAPIQGGPADPRAPQKPAAGYEWTAQGVQAIKGGPADPTSAANLVSNEGNLRKEYEAQGLLPYIAARNGYEKVLSAARDNTGASDIALIFGFMKTLDPTSTVREGEFSTAQNSGSIDQSVMNAYNRALKGERLLPEQRAAFARTAAGQFGVAQQRLDQLNERYGGIAQSYGFDPTRIIQRFPAPAASVMGGPPAPNPAVVAPAGPAGSREAALAEARRRKLIP